MARHDTNMAHSRGGASLREFLVSLSTEPRSTSDAKKKISQLQKICPPPEPACPPACVT